MIATGVLYRKLDVPGIERLTGAGVYYGTAMTQALSCRDEDVYMIGEANSAGQAAMYFSKYARKATMLVRADSLSKGISQYLADQIIKTENIQVWLHSSVIEVKGENKLEAVIINDAIRGEKQSVPVISNRRDLEYYDATCRIGIYCIVRAGETYLSWNLTSGLAHELNNPAAAAGRVTTHNYIKYFKHYHHYPLKSINGRILRQSN